MNTVEIMEKEYGIKPLRLQRLQVGAGSNTYRIEADKGIFILKNPNSNEINNPELEPKLCEFLLERGIAVSQFVKNCHGSYITLVEGEIYHLQRFIEGENFGLNEAPAWLMEESAKTLGRIHQELKSYEHLPEGIGTGFFKHMTPERVKGSYKASLEIAKQNGESNIIEGLHRRIELLEDFKDFQIDLQEISCGNTHGDYFISQIIAGDREIAGVIDWTTACVHPYVWEVIRSFVYGEPECMEGQIPIGKLLSYVQSYIQYNSLTAKDLELMPELFYYQLAVCDYYMQYYKSTAANRHIYLQQAEFSTSLMDWLHNHKEELKEALLSNITR